MEVADAAAYARLAALVTLQAALHCRIPVTPANASHFIPLLLPVWGVVEGDHIHLDNHYSLALHSDDGGRLTAAAAYPVRDRFQLVQPGSVISLHGPVRWQAKGGPRAAREPAPAGGAKEGGAAAEARGCAPELAVAWGAVALLVVRSARVELATPKKLTQRAP